MQCSAVQCSAVQFSCTTQCPVSAHWWRNRGGHFLLDDGQLGTEQNSALECEQRSTLSRSPWALAQLETAESTVECVSPRREYMGVLQRWTVRLCATSAPYSGHCVSNLHQVNPLARAGHFLIDRFPCFSMQRTEFQTDLVPHTARSRHALQLCSSLGEGLEHTDPTVRMDKEALYCTHLPH